MSALETDELVLEIEDEDVPDRFREWFLVGFAALSVIVVAFSARDFITLIEIISMINSFAE